MVRQGKEEEEEEEGGRKSRMVSAVGAAVADRFM